AAVGGIKAIRTTNILHFCMIIFALPMMAVIALSRVGGFEALWARLPADHLTLSLSDPAAFRFFSMFCLFAVPALYPIVIQRLLMARDIRQARQILLFKAGLMALFLVVPITIGLIAFSAAPEIEPKSSLAYVMHNILPVGARGLALCGMLAMIMSTTDSFLNSISVAIAHDILKPLKKSFLSTGMELMVARFSTLLVAVLIAVCALKFGDIFLGLLGSMNIWLPFFFPPLFLGILGVSGNFRDFAFGGYFAILAWWVGAQILFWSTPWAVLLATGANFLTLLGRYAYFRWSALESTSAQVTTLQEAVVQKEPEYALFASLTLGSTMLPFFFWSYQGEEIDGATFGMYLVAACLCLTLLLKDHFSWLSKTYWDYHWYLVLLFCLPLISAFAAVQSKFSLFWVLDFILVGFLLWVFVPRQIYWVILSIGLLSGVILAHIHLEHCHLSINDFWLPQLSFMLHVLSLGACFIVFRHRAAVDVLMERTHGGNMAHTFQTLLAQFLIEAKTLKKSMPALIDAYQKALAGNQVLHRIGPKRLNFLESMPLTMQRNTVRLQSNVAMMLGKMGLAVEVSGTEAVWVQRSVSAVLKTFHLPVSWQPVGRLSFLGNSDLFELALLELLKNASEAIQTAGLGNISIHLHEQARELWLEDTVGGIPTHQTEKIFEHRFTTKTDGTGIGLHYCKLVFKGWGGDIRCVSEQGVLTRFIIKLPEPKTKQEISA
ncbi:MAG: ATP-binding protein, partial [Myxococcaceae bacterium]